MKFKVYNKLPDEAVKIREEVFVREQGFENEFDEIDDNAWHIVLFWDDAPAAVCRFYKDRSSEKYIVGRIAVLKPYRGRKFGSLLLEKAEDEIKKAGGERAELHAQVQAVPFYEKQGYSVYGGIGYEEYCPHIWMAKEIK